MSRPLALFAPILAVLAAGPVIVWATEPAKASAATAFESEASMTLRRLELGASTLSAAGATTTETTQVVSDMDDWLGNNEGEIASASATLNSATQAWTAMRSKIQSGQATSEEIESLPSLESAKNAAQSALSSLHDEAFDAAVDGLSEAKQSLAANVRANSAWKFKPYFLVVNRTEANWIALRDALDEQRIATKYGESTSSAALAIISAALADQDVASAKVNYDSNLSSIETAWNSAVAE